MQAGASIRMNHSGLKFSRIWHHAQPLRNASQSQISIPTQPGCLPTLLGLDCRLQYPPAVSTTHCFAPRAKTRFIPIALHSTLESKAPGCETTHTMETPNHDRNPCPVAPTTKPHAGWHAPSPDRLPKTTPWFRLGETTGSKGATRRIFQSCHTRS